MNVPFADLAADNREISDEMDDAWRRVSASGRFIGGPEVEAFEQRWATYCAVEHCLGVANGTDALFLALRALGIGEGDEVVVPANTFIATAEAVVHAGAQPRFVDVDPDTLVVTGRDIERVLNDRTAAVIVVHLFGHMPDMDDIQTVTRRAGIALIEDAAQAHGATWRGQRAGSFGAAGCFSFYPGKNLGALGDGGAIVSRNASVIDTARSIADHGRSATDRGHHPNLGVNSRLDAVQAALLSVKLSRLESWTQARQRLAATYRVALAEAGIGTVEPPEGGESARHLLVARVRGRDRLRQALGDRGIETGIHYPIPCHRQAPFLRFADGALPIVEEAAAEIVSLPFFPSMREEQVHHVVSAIDDIVGAPVR